MNELAPLSRRQQHEVTGQSLTTLSIGDVHGGSSQWRTSVVLYLNLIYKAHVINVKFSFDSLKRAWGPLLTLH